MQYFGKKFNGEQQALTCSTVMLCKYLMMSYRVSKRLEIPRTFLSFTNCASLLLSVLWPLLLPSGCLSNSPCGHCCLLLFSQFLIQLQCFLSKLFFLAEENSSFSSYAVIILVNGCIKKKKPTPRQGIFLIFFSSCDYLLFRWRVASEDFTKD